jgi:hypothetical protein
MKYTTTPTTTSTTYAPHNCAYKFKLERIADALAKVDTESWMPADTNQLVQKLRDLLEGKTDV